MQKIIESAWEDRSLLEKSEVKEAIREIINQLDIGRLRVASLKENRWQVNEWVKKAVILYFPIQKMETIELGPLEFHDKIPLKGRYKEKGIRVVPHAVARHGSYISNGVILMPSYVNIGAYIDEGTMMDTFSRAGSCCQIGKNCHISAGTGIGGVLEPAQALPTIIEDNVFVGAMSEVVEGVIVGEGSVLSMGMYIGQSTKIVNRKTGEVTHGKIPPYSVVVPGSLPDKNNPTSPSLYCAVIIKQVDEKTRSKTSVNDLLRD